MAGARDGRQPRQRASFLTISISHLVDPFFSSFARSEVKAQQTVMAAALCSSLEFQPKRRRFVMKFHSARNLIALAVTLVAAMIPARPGKSVVDRRDGRQLGLHPHLSVLPRTVPRPLGGPLQPGCGGERHRQPDPQRRRKSGVRHPGNYQHKWRRQERTINVFVNDSCSAQPSWRSPMIAIGNHARMIFQSLIAGWHECSVVSPSTLTVV